MTIKIVERPSRGRMIEAAKKLLGVLRRFVALPKAREVVKSVEDWDCPDYLDQRLFFCAISAGSNRPGIIVMSGAPGNAQYYLCCF